MLLIVATRSLASLRKLLRSGYKYRNKYWKKIHSLYWQQLTSWTQEKSTELWSEMALRCRKSWILRGETRSTWTFRALVFISFELGFGWEHSFILSVLQHLNHLSHPNSAQFSWCYPDNGTTATLTTPLPPPLSPPKHTRLFTIHKAFEVSNY